MATLMLVPTPVGNLEDITLRALRMLREADCIYAEDTRVTRKLLNHYEISKPVYPFHAHNEHRTLDFVMDKIKENNLTVLVSDAGTPGISDPGFLLVRACIEADIVVSCLPGATALIPALVGSGFGSDRFCFEGFLPHKKGRQTKLKELALEEKTVVLYESPHRLVKCLGQIAEFFEPTRKVCVAREISKIYEEFKRGEVQDVLKHYEAHPPKGEIVIIIEGKNGKN
ncbi:MAG: 16S rRNA (cytidine(1402)-2'-O)-methyltransferase [Crocinitomicaceae bacterium]|jgi:16S rRNA (cytidine1402-2'-O)-methyltransferase|nr:16S rRNA (cytidine(1402)-2'-O)-methyltransferase [Crocinitomicaceae bacterium]